MLAVGKSQNKIATKVFYSTKGWWFHRHTIIGDQKIRCSVASSISANLKLPPGCQIKFLVKRFASQKIISYKYQILWSSWMGHFQLLSSPFWKRRLKKRGQIFWSKGQLYIMPALAILQSCSHLHAHIMSKAAIILPINLHCKAIAALLFSLYCCPIWGYIANLIISFYTRNRPAKPKTLFFQSHLIIISLK